MRRTINKFEVDNTVTEQTEWKPIRDEDANFTETNPQLSFDERIVDDGVIEKFDFDLIVNFDCPF